MTKWRNQGMVLMLAAAVIIGAGCASEAPETSLPDTPAETGEAVKTGPFKNMKAPDFSLKDMEGTEWSLSQLKGNSVALVFFTSW